MTGNEHPQNHEKSEQLTKDPRTAKANQLGTGNGHSWSQKKTNRERAIFKSRNYQESGFPV